MGRKAAKGYFVKGQFVAEGSELDLQLQEEAQAGGPSRTTLKRESADLQRLGEQLVALPAAQRKSLDVPEGLATAIETARGIEDFEGRRRQMQYVGKLMRRLDAADVDRLRSVVDETKGGLREQTLELHRAENWRQRLVDQDEALTDWLAAYPQTDAQRLRSIIRQARKDATPTAEQVSRGEAPRRGRAWRELFQFIKDAGSSAAA